MWHAAQFDPGSWKSYRGDGTRFINVFGRLRQGVTLASAQGELSVLGNQMGSEHSDTDAQWRFTSRSMRDYVYGSVRPALLILLTASFLLLLIGCVNVANLLLSRAASREREVALRQALGASRKRIMRQLLTESLLIALLGGTAGLGLAYALVHWTGTRLPGVFRSQDGITMDWPVAGFALAVSITAGVFFGLAPALQTGRGDLNRGLKTGEVRMAGAAGNRLRSVFIAVQVGLSLMLLVSASLLAQSLWNLMRSPLGFAPDHLLVFKAELPWEGKPASTDAFFTETQRRIETLPGVASAGQITALPTVDWHNRSNYDADWLPHTPHQDAVSAENRHIFGHYLEAMHIPLLAGRELRVDDGFAVLVNQEFVRRYSPDQSPVGRYLLNQQSIGVSGSRQPGIQIVGVVGDVRGTSGSISSEVLPEVYYPAAGINTRWFVVRSLVPPAQLTEAVRKIVHDVDPQQSIGDVQTMEERLDTAVAQPRLNMALLVSFAGIALLLACVGIYGVVAYSVAQRRQEIGVRMALGATRRQISLLFLRGTMMATLFGLGGGGIATLLLTRLLRSQLYGVEPNSLPTFSIAVLLLLIPVLAASLRPALKAASVHPVEALRTE
jgi:putative ABC transport system permease protein